MFVSCDFEMCGGEDFVCNGDRMTLHGRFLLREGQAQGRMPYADICFHATGFRHGLRSVK